MDWASVSSHPRKSQAKSSKNTPPKGCYQGPGKPNSTGKKSNYFKNKDKTRKGRVDSREKWEPSREKWEIYRAKGKSDEIGSIEDTVNVLLSLPTHYTCFPPKKKFDLNSNHKEYILKCKI